MPTDQERYDRLSSEVFALYGKGRYAEALTLVEADLADLPEWRSDLAHTAACLHARAGDPDTALRVLTDAAGAGAWWHPLLLLEDDDLASLTTRDGFAELVDVSRRRCEAAQTSAGRLPPVVARPDGAARGVLVALHGAGQHAGTAAAAWHPATGDGFVVLAVESSQLSTPTYRSWPDQAVAARDVGTALGILDPAERELPLVAGGFSAGARAALLWALSGEPCPVAGVVAVAPAVRREQVADPVHAPPGLVVIGAEDEMVDDVTESVAGLPDVRLDVVPGLAHTYPDDFAERLAAALRRFVPRGQ
jgi:hypothetical protein